MDEDNRASACPVTAGYRLLLGFGAVVAPIALLAIRLAWGWELVESGYRHLHNVEGMVKHFQEWGVPYPRPNVYISGWTEMVGGALLMLGLGARLISIPLFFNFCVAYLTAGHYKVTHFFQQDPSNFIDDDAFPFLMTSLLIIGFGPGLLSIDAIIKRCCCRKKRDTSPAGQAS